MFNKYPFIKQEGLKDCGCSCLLMIIRYYKGNVSFEKLRDLSHTGKNGTNAYNLIRCANTLGFNSKGVRANINDLENVLLPCIAHVIIDNIYKHYVVIYDINFDKKFLLIADPAKKIMKISFDDFEKIWTGVLIILYPCRSLPIEKNISICKFIYLNIFRYKRDVILLLILSFFVILLKVVSSFFFKFIIQGIDISKSYIRNIFLIFTLLVFTKLIIGFLRNKFLIILNSKLDFSLVLDAFKHVISLPYHYYHNRTTGEIISRINDLESARDFISKVCVNFFIDLPLIIISIIFLCLINYKLFFICFIMFCLYLFLSIIYGKIYKYYIERIKLNKEIVNSYMYESIGGFETVKGISLQDKIINNFNRKYIVLLNNIYKLQNHVNNQSFFKDFICDIGNLIILFVGALFVIDGSFSIGYLITYSSLIVYFFEPIRNIIDMDVNIKDSHESITRVLSLYEVCDNKGIVNFRNGDIELKKLHFTFDNKDSIFSSINLFIGKGEHVMITGPSGSGKSTLLKLLMGYYKVDRGMLYIDNIDFNDYKIKSIRKNISYISQNEIIFNDTLLNNLKFYCNDNDDVINMTRLMEFNEILDSNLGLNMMIEENGFNLSGGQRQRIVLARTLLRKSEILLIDEGLSQIDVALERKILKNIFDLYKDKTVIIISHRLENLDLYDRLISIDGGTIVKDERIK